jgi:hypothetical protein
LDGLERQHRGSPAVARLDAHADGHASTHTHVDASNADGYAPTTDEHADVDTTTGHAAAISRDAATGRTDARVA